MTMMYVMHHAFRRDLAAFAAAASATPVDDRTTWRALAERWDAVRRGAAPPPQRRGRRALAAAAGARPTTADRATLEAMEAEHAEIDPLLEACAAGFARLAEHADDDARRRSRCGSCAARERLRRHLRHEETEAIAIIQRLLTQEDWERLEEEHFKQDIDLRGRSLSARAVGGARRARSRCWRGLFAQDRRPVHQGGLAAHPAPVRAARRRGPSGTLAA